MADAIIGNTELLPAKQDLVAELVQRELQAQAKLLPTFFDVSRFAVKGAKSIAFPKVGSFTVVKRTSGTAADSEAVDTTTDILNLDQNAYVAWLVDSCDEVQTNFDVQLELARRAASALARDVDATAIAELEATGVATTTLGDITADIVLEMREALCSRNADMNRLWLAVGCDQEAALLRENKFSSAEVYGSSAIPSGVIGKVYGVNVIVSNLIPASTYYMYEQSALAIGFQKGPNMSDQLENSFGAMSRRYAMDQLYGVKAMQIGEAGVGVAESALIVKDGN